MIQFEEKPGGYISKIIFNNNEEISINKSDIVIFVGPNNSGKSQCLKDIYELCNSKISTIVVEDLVINKSSSQIETLLESMSTISDHGTYKNYAGLNYNIPSHTLRNVLQNKYFGFTRPLFVTYLSTLNRLSIVDPPQLINRDAAKTHPIHYISFDSKYRKWLSKNFKKAFGDSIVPNIHFGSNIPLCIGEPVILSDDFIDEQERQEEYARVLDNYKHVHNQGDGIKSFTGILLYLMLDYVWTFLIDEPESFLHPPQSNIMGRIIGETLTDNQQAFISTHSEDILKGLISVCPNRIKLVRITRTNDINRFSTLDNAHFLEIWKDPLLKHSNIMSSLFHSNVVLCESDSDCKMYSIIDNHIKESKNKFSETLFIHCGGKHRMAKVAKALKSLNVDVKLIPDIDILNDEKIFREITETFDIDWHEISSLYRVFISNINSEKKC